MSAATDGPVSNKAGNPNALLLNSKLRKPSRGTELDRQTEIRAIAELERHPHFHGRSQWVQCRCSNGRLRLDGCLPSYYLKQLAQVALRNLNGIDRIENRIVVASSSGIVGSGKDSPVVEQPPRRQPLRERDPTPQKPR